MPPFLLSVYRSASQSPVCPLCLYLASLCVIIDLSCIHPSTYLVIVYLSVCQLCLLSAYVLCYRQSAWLSYVYPSVHLPVCRPYLPSLYPSVVIISLVFIHSSVSLSFVSPSVCHPSVDQPSICHLLNPSPVPASLLPSLSVSVCLSIHPSSASLCISCVSISM